MNLSTSSKVTLLPGRPQWVPLTSTAPRWTCPSFEGVMFICRLGTITDGNLSVKAQVGRCRTHRCKADLAGTLTTMATNAHDNNVCVLDLYRPLERYITPGDCRGGSTGAVMQGLDHCDPVRTALQADRARCHHGGDVEGLVISPADGTA
jgi:hypothetical protein